MKKHPEHRSRPSRFTELSIKEINLEELLDIYPKMLKGQTSGRYLVNLNK